MRLSTKWTAVGAFLGMLSVGTWAATPAGAGDEEVVAGDPAAGRQHVMICLACHSLRPGYRGTGPSLFGIVGRPAGSLPGFDYSETMREAGFDWTPERLRDFLTDPEEIMPGTRMAFPGISSPQARADLVAYLSLLTDD